MSKLTIVTTSWDDGDPQDRKISDLLSCRGISGTFYIPLTGYRGRPTMRREDVRALSQNAFEVGGHGMSHMNLPGLPAGKIDYELRVCKQELEDMTGNVVDMFCYPRGRYDHQVVRAVTKSGYVGARTTQMLAHRLNFRPFLMPTGLQVYPHANSTYLKNLCRARNMVNLFDFATRLRAATNWVELGRRLFDMVMQDGGIWHLFGHSWEISDLELWNDLEEILDYVCRRPGVSYLTNGEVIRTLQPKFGSSPS
jgi:peptidoglycan-N-acetylglucosamine deacetylase